MACEVWVCGAAGVCLLLILILRGWLPQPCACSSRHTGEHVVCIKWVRLDYQWDMLIIAGEANVLLPTHQHVKSIV